MSMFLYKSTNSSQCDLPFVCVNRYIGWVTPKTIYFYHNEFYFSDQSIAETFYSLLKTKSLVTLHMNRLQTRTAADHYQQLITVNNGFVTASRKLLIVIIKAVCLYNHSCWWPLFLAFWFFAYSRIHTIDTYLKHHVCTSCIHTIIYIHT